MYSMVPSCGDLLASRYSTCCPPGQYRKAWPYPTRYTWPQTQAASAQRKTSSRLPSLTDSSLLFKNVSHLRFLSLSDVNVFCSDVSVDILIQMDKLQHIQLQGREMFLSIRRVGAAVLREFWIFWSLILRILGEKCTSWHPLFYKQYEEQLFLTEACFLPPWQTGETGPSLEKSETYERKTK